MDRIDALFEWLVDGAPGAATAPDVIEHVATKLVESGVPVERAGAFVFTLHPEIAGRAFWWEPGKPVRVGDLSLAQQSSALFRDSPVAEVGVTRKEVRCRLALGELPYPVAHELAGDGFTDYVALPLAFLSGDAHALTFATKRAGGFTDADLEALRRIARPLSRIAEILALKRTATNLLSTYVGHDAGGRVLAGNIRKGDIDTIRAVIWFSDLRGFTEMSSRSTPREIIDTLNELFDCQVGAVQKHGGEVLKFIGDGMLAIFPLTGDDASPALCAEVLAAADDAFAALDARNASAARRIDFGLALHVGEIAYGNVGGASRLDFTAIGSAVNLAARLEGLTGKLGRRLVVSTDFASHVARPLDDLGAFELKGVPAPQHVFAPR